MKIRITNVYNTQSEKKTIKELKKIAKKHTNQIKAQIKKIDKNIIFTLESINYVDWREQKRGEDIRFYLNLSKTGKTITAREIYSLCNKTCLRPCYF